MPPVDVPLVPLLDELEYLVVHRDRVLRREEILQKVWDTTAKQIRARWTCTSRGCGKNYPRHIHTVQRPRIQVLFLTVHQTRVVPVARLLVR